MCGIVGFSNLDGAYLQEEGRWVNTIDDMLKEVHHRGNEGTGQYIDACLCMGHTRLVVRDLVTGGQPVKKCVDGNEYVIVYDGEVYNTAEIKKDLSNHGFSFETASDAEVVLSAYIKYGADCANRLNGTYSFAIWDTGGKTLYLCRDRVGVKPLFYTVRNNTLVFGSEIKALFQFPGIKPAIDEKSLREIFGLGPARTPGVGVFQDIHEVLPGHFAIYRDHNFKQTKYWDLTDQQHTDSYEETVEHVSFLVRDAVKRQMVSDVPICSFLSGGIDSSVVTAIAANELAKEGKTLDTFSFDFSGNDQYFQSNAFQPERDRPYVDKMLQAYKTNHTYLECDEASLFGLLYEVVDGKDLPGMADVDASLLYFCRQVKGQSTVALTGECSDEIFSGYPWFHREELLALDAFPWSHNIETRKMFLSEELRGKLDIDGYVRETYEQALRTVPTLMVGDRLEKRRREVSYLTIRWFMTTLLDRMDRMGACAGIEGRAPFADYRILDYVFNVPWEMKSKDGVGKSLLREATKDLLPEELLYRKKSPFPKTYNPRYEQLLVDKLRNILADHNSPLLPLIDAKAVGQFLETPSDYGKPWFGQLMAGPQMMAYLIQVEYWLKKYNVSL